MSGKGNCRGRRLGRGIAWDRSVATILGIPETAALRPALDKGKAAAFPGRCGVSPQKGVWRKPRTGSDQGEGLPPSLFLLCGTSVYGRRDPIQNAPFPVDCALEKALRRHRPRRRKACRRLGVDPASKRRIT